MTCNPKCRLQRVELTVSKTDLWLFSALLRRGFHLRTPLPCSLEALLCIQLEIPRDYVTQRVQTIFLNGRAVDTICSALVADGAVVTHSAAMPGLVGATLRRGGRLTSLRSSISHRSDGSSGQETAIGKVTVKFFNLICDELGPSFLARGICLAPGAFSDFLADRWAEIAPACRSVRVDGSLWRSDSLPEAIDPGEPINLSVCTFE